MNSNNEISHKVVDISTKKYIIQKTLSSGIANVINGITSISKDMILSRLLGSGAIMSAWFASTRIALIIKMICADRALQILTPIYNDIFKGKNTNLGKKKFGVYLLIMIFIISIVGILVFSLTFLKPLLSNNSIKEIQLSLKLIPMATLYFMLVSLASSCVGILNFHGKYFLPALLVTIYNIVIISVIIIFHNMSPEEIVVKMNKFLVIAGILQVLLITFLLIKVGQVPKFTTNIKFTLGTIKRRFGKTGLMACSGALINYLDRFNYIALFSGAYGISSLYYGGKLIHIPIMFSMWTLGNALVVSMTRAFSDKRYYDLFNILKYIMKLICHIAIPFSIILLMFKYQIINQLFGGYQFGEKSVYEVAKTMNIFVIKIPFECFLIATNLAFYAIKKSNVSILVATIGIIINYALSIILIFIVKMDHVGIIISSVSYTIISFIILQIILIKDYKEYYNGILWLIPTIIKSLLISIISILITNQSYIYIINLTDTSRFYGGIALSISIAIFIILYITINTTINKFNCKIVIEN